MLIFFAFRKFLVLNLLNARGTQFSELPVQHNILEDNFVICRVTLIKWVANYAHFVKKQGSDSGQPSSMISTGSQHGPHSGTPTPAVSMHHEEETSFTVGLPSDSSRASSHDSASITPHQSLESGQCDTFFL